MGGGVFSCDNVGRQRSKLLSEVKFAAVKTGLSTEAEKLRQ
jgi:hypothetical protein